MQPLLIQKGFGIVETDPADLIKERFESRLLGFRELALIIFIHQAIQLLLRSRLQTLQLELRLLELNQVLEAHLQRFADSSDDGAIQFLNWLRGCQPVETLPIHFEAALL